MITEFRYGEYGPVRSILGMEKFGSVFWFFGLLVFWFFSVDSVLGNFRLFSSCTMTLIMGAERSNHTGLGSNHGKTSSFDLLPFINVVWTLI